MSATVCRCGLYRFPHRKSDRCDDYADEMRDVADEISSRSRDLADFERTEAAAYNAELRQQA